MKSTRTSVEVENERLKAAKALAVKPFASAADLAEEFKVDVDIMRELQRKLAYRMRERWETALDEALRSATIQAEQLESEAIRRAYEGVDKPVFYKGKECGAIREFSDTLMMFLLKGMMPAKYRDRTETTLQNPDGTAILAGLQISYVNGSTPDKEN